MNKELKQRIEQINAGTAPAGYKKTKVGIVPEEWEVVSLAEVLHERKTYSQKGLEYPHVTLSTEGIYLKTERFDRDHLVRCENKEYKITHRNDICYNPANLKFGVICRNTFGDAIFSPIYVTFEVDNGFNVDFVAHYLMRWDFINAVRKYEEGTVYERMAVKPDDFLRFKLVLPALPEQQKIAEILNAQDEVIALQEKQIEILNNQKKAFLQKMFPKKGCEYPEIRFSGFTGAWKQYHLGDLYIERNEKGNDSLPILSVSIRSGVSDGELDTEALGKIVRRSEDKSTYKHVFCGDLVFNMMRAWQGAIGVVKREGMVSPAYISAIPNEKVYPPFMNYLLRRRAAVDQINDLSYGVTDFRKRLYWKSFIRVSCQLPSLQEQKMITELFESLNALIDQHQRKLEFEQQKKKALMQLLLTGKVRVKT